MGMSNTSGTADFLFELGTEELPPTALLGLSEALGSGMRRALEDAALSFDALTLFATPRRLAVRVSALQLRQIDRQVEKRGPPEKIAFDGDGNPTRAASAFAQGCGVPVEDLARIETPKGVWLAYSAVAPGESAASLLPGIIDRAVAELPSPKRMRWGSGDAEFVRPVHWMVALLGEQIVDAQVLGIQAGRTTYGHRFHAPGAIELGHPTEYEQQLLERGSVVADFADRRAQIRDGVMSAAKANGGTAIIDDALLDEVTALVELPVPLWANFDAPFLQLPDEVLISTLQEHQRYFPVRDDKGGLMAGFITVSNLRSLDPDQVRNGNERVVRPRLADAAFFWEADRKRPLAQRVDDLERVVYQEKLGSLGAKAQRVGKLAGYIAQQIGADVALAERAARLAKTDLLTDLVGEFPDLQGVMGSYYATADGEPAAVALALKEQYLPRFAGDGLPQGGVGQALAVADKLDTIVGIFAVGARPKGNKDPFALRRSALGVMRVLIEGELALDLSQSIDRAVAGLPPGLAQAGLAQEVFEFMLERLRAYYLGGGKAQDEALEPTIFEAVLARRPAQPLDFDQRVQAVRQFLTLDAAESLAAANKRIANILRQAGTVGEQVDPQLLKLPAEQALHGALSGVQDEVRALLDAREYSAALQKLAALREPVDVFFEQVMVMDEDAAVRSNRLALLGQMQGLFGHTADLSLLQTR